LKELFDAKTFRTVILQWMVWRKYFDWRIWASLVPIVGGILLTSVTELSFNVFGFCAALFGCLATSTKTILAESLLHGYKFDRYPLFFISYPLIDVFLFAVIFGFEYYLEECYDLKKVCFLQNITAVSSMPRSV